MPLSLNVVPSFAGCRRRAVLARAIILSLAIALRPAAARSQSLGAGIDASPRAARPPVTAAAMTIEGGGTLGVYEAGVSWVLTEVFRQRRLIQSGNTQGHDPALLAVVGTLPLMNLAGATGASAGSINALLTATRWCAQEPPTVPQGTEFWRAWVSTGLPQLLPVRGRPEWDDRALFSRQHFDSLVLPSLRTAWKAQTPDSTCPPVPLGATMTRFDKDSLALSRDVAARNQRYASGVVVAAPARPGLLPQFRPVAASAVHLQGLGAFVQLPSSGDTTDLFAVEQLIKASSGYPVAFEPLPVPHCTRMERTDLKAPTCPNAGTLRMFVDGGVFDNGPLLLSYSLALANDSLLRLDRMYMLYITPDHRRHTRQMRDIADEKVRDERKSPYGLDALFTLAGNFVPSARQYELQAASRMLPTMQVRDMAAQSALDSAARLLATISRRDTTILALRSHLASERDRVDTVVALGRRVVAAYADSLAVEIVSCRDVEHVCAADSLLARLSRLSLPDLRRVDSISGDVEQAGGASDGLLTRTPFDSLLLVTTRFHPLAGSWLSGFGGLIGRPLREYDFHVGIYDGLALIARQIKCRQLSGDVQSSCFADSLKALIDTPPVPLDSSARRLLRALYDVEFSGAVRSPDAEVNVKDRFLLAIVNAMAARMQPPDAAPSARCPGGALERLGCSQGMTQLFRELKKDTTLRRVVRRATSARECTGHAALGPSCFVDDQFAAFVRGPVAALNEVAGELLVRLDKTTDTAKKVVVLASAAYFSTNERGRRNHDLGSNSLPSNPRGLVKWLRAAPSSVGTIGGASSLYGEWAARYHTSPDFAFGGGARVYWTRAFETRRPGSDEIFNSHWQGVPTLRAEYKPPSRISPFISSIGLEGGYWLDFRQTQSSTGTRASGGVTASLLAQKLRVSMLTRPTAYRMNGREPPFLFTVGVGDVNGLAYWIIRLVR